MLCSTRSSITGIILETTNTMLLQSKRCSIRLGTTTLLCRQIRLEPLETTIKHFGAWPPCQPLRIDYLTSKTDLHGSLSLKPCSKLSIIDGIQRIAVAGSSGRSFSRIPDTPIRTRSLMDASSISLHVYISILETIRTLIGPKRLGSGSSPSDS